MSQQSAFPVSVDEVEMEVRGQCGIDGGLRGRVIGNGGAGEGDGGAIFSGYDLIAVLSEAGVLPLVLAADGVVAGESNRVLLGGKQAYLDRGIRRVRHLDAEDRAGDGRVFQVHRDQRVVGFQRHLDGGASSWKAYQPKGNSPENVRFCMAGYGPTAEVWRVRTRVASPALVRMAKKLLGTTPLPLRCS